jgi:hypothetical protein
MAVLTNLGRAAIAESVRQREMYLAWGTGDPTWEDTPPNEGLLASVGLVNEVGRRLCEKVEFCVPDDFGRIITPTGRFEPSEEITNNLSFEVEFDFEDACDLYIRELGIFIGTIIAEDVPIGQKYVTPNKIINPGTLLVLERCAEIHRQIMTREKFEFVITF